MVVQLEDRVVVLIEFELEEGTLVSIQVFVQQHALVHVVEFEPNVP